ncbi:hypothetical protein Xcel_2571 [Xylanimonas cellulosilytica DSM 15894]|uniref:Uncharacterized protein n=1 Tax=Xylanimonas cellulosilytica (strain DSM 15894 / JCM 12276 / CECT 5975 / KCTC 9989 / LMG 20990 / NBRC 107835 / XIL07) TaxID=446471 RepID=D1BX18_XYLCX|nr:DUF6541 family protein [Xylanimonas cellulosilytica]ACZ31586.1 hypothetical protein Xcel_2571 [Xylanimonas cellulosilytica DSM 15894]
MNPAPLAVADWIPLIPAVLVAVAVLFAPGLVVVAATTRLRPWSIALAPVVSVAIVGVSGVVWGFLGQRWSLPAVAISTVVVAAIAYALRRVLRADGGSEPAPARAHWLWAAGGLAVGGMITAAQFVRAIGHPSAISQTFDAIFHVNAVQWVLTSGNGSVFGLADFTGNAFYQMGWHQNVALVAQLTGLGIPEAISATNIAIGAVVWPAGCIALVATFFPRAPWLAAAGGIVSAAFGAFPYRLIDFGVLYPNFFSYALLPASLALLVRVLGLPRTEPVATAGERTVRILLLLVAAGGLGFAQPMGLMALVAMAVPLVLWRGGTRVWALFSDGRRPEAVRAGGVVLGVLALVALLWQVARPPEIAAGWPPVQGTGAALGLAFTVSPWSGNVSWVVVILMTAGLIVLCRRPERAWIAGPWAAATVLYVASSAMPVGNGVRMFLSGVFLNDSERTAALLPIGAIVVCALGAETVVRLLRSAAARVPALRAPRLLTVGATAVALVAVYGVAVDNGSTEAAVHSARRTHALTGPLLTTGERTLLERLPELTAPDALIAGNPNTGAALAFALGERDVTEAHGFSTPSDDVLLVARRLDRIDTDPRVCAAIEREGIDYVLDFGDDEVLPWSVAGIDYSGFDDVRPGAHLELVDRAGRAELFRVTC